MIATSGGGSERTFCMTSVFRALYAQLLVVHALALRETRTRFGNHQLGYLWAILEPTLTIITFYIVFRISHRHPPGMDIWGFVATGVVPYTLFSTAANQVATSINANRALLFYPRVRPLDLVLARAGLEFSTHILVFWVLIFGQALYLQHFEVDQLLSIFLGFILAGLLGAGVGLLFCGLSEFSKIAERARGPLLRPLFWVSGIFFVPDQIPEKARTLLLANPVLHIVELVRDGFYRSYSAEFVSIPYVLFWILGVLLIGLALERVVRRGIEVT